MESGQLGNVDVVRADVMNLHIFYTNFVKLSLHCTHMVIVIAIERMVMLKFK